MIYALGRHMQVLVESPESIARREHQPRARRRYLLMCSCSEKRRANGNCRHTVALLEEGIDPKRWRDVTVIEMKSRDCRDGHLRSFVVPGGRSRRISASAVLGSGTTALVARRLGRRSIGIELNPAYCALAGERLQQQSLFAAPQDLPASREQASHDHEWHVDLSSPIIDTLPQQAVYTCECGESMIRGYP